MVPVEPVQVFQLWEKSMHPIDNHIKKRSLQVYYYHYYRELYLDKIKFHQRDVFIVAINDLVHFHKTLQFNYNSITQQPEVYQTLIWACGCVIDWHTLWSFWQGWSCQLLEGQPLLYTTLCLDAFLVTVNVCMSEDTFNMKGKVYVVKGGI